MALFSFPQGNSEKAFCFSEFCGAKWSREKKVLPTKFIDIYKCIRDICVIISTFRCGSGQLKGKQRQRKPGKGSLLLTLQEATFEEDFLSSFRKTRDTYRKVLLKLISFDSTKPYYLYQVYIYVHIFMYIYIFSIRLVRGFREKADPEKQAWPSMKP